MGEIPSVSTFTKQFDGRISFTWAHRVAAWNLQLGKMFLPLDRIVGHSKGKIISFEFNGHSFGKYELSLGIKVEKKWKTPILIKRVVNFSRILRDGH